MPRPPITKTHPWTPSSGAFVGRTFSTEREYRDALARRKGFRSWAEQQRAPGRLVFGLGSLMRLRPSERLAYERVGTALSLMHRDESLPPSEAARRAHTTLAAVHRHAGQELRESGRGRFRAAPIDRHDRRLWFITPHGLTIIDTRNSRTASLIGEYDAAVEWYLIRGDDSRLARFQGKVVRSGGRRYPFVTDLDTLDELARRGEVSFESIYATSR